ncbi:MAG: sensor histidine kinase [Janthinobacterium lividum]
MLRSSWLYHVLFWVLLIGAANAFDTLGRYPGAFTWGHYGESLSQLDTWVEFGRIMLTIYGSGWLFSRVVVRWQLPAVLALIVGLGVLDALLADTLQRYVVPLLNTVPDLSPLPAFTTRLPLSWLFVMLAFVFRQVSNERRTQALVHEKNAMELAFLKAQLNPHFLFNSMNNLYGLALTEPERTPDAILRLAELMRYMLYESSAERVPLAQEVAYLRSYVALETLRHEGEVHIDFQVKGTLAGLAIAPLLLICFVENAFKHGTVHNPDQPIQLHLAVTQETISFTTRNQVVTQNKDQAGGVGLATVRRRLALLYPRHHRLTIHNSPTSFCCELELSAVAPPTQPSLLA